MIFGLCRPNLPRSNSGRLDLAADRIFNVKKAKRFLVKGRVQGVGYRFFAERVALDLGLTGYVRNLADGRVEIYAAGDDDALAQLRKQLQEGPRAARVDGVEEEAAVLKKHKNFSIEV